MPVAPRRPAGARYWPGLDGVRAIAIVAVVVYHLSPGALPGGFLGVDLFFVVSGYLITTLLTDEWRRQGTIELLRFWGRRVRRLYPAIAALVAVLVPVTALLDPRALAESRLTIVAALVYLTNWWFIFHHVSYFERFGPPPLLVHLWSLAIEEQYYLIWPPLLVLLLRRRRPARIALLALAGAAASALLMGLLYHGAGSLDRVYYGSDTHAEGLLFGSALALVAPPTGFPASVDARARRVL
ncbi:MAG TPA: acyltransferase, partial [Acidimicrobiales bacterium]|nr:acyltransferase [Acidimicrobiales bacterium]